VEPCKPCLVAAPCVDVMGKSGTEECLVDCTYEGERKLYINPNQCIDCGACESACSQEAIFTDFKAIDGDAEFIADNLRLLAEPLESVPSRWAAAARAERPAAWA
jgi:NAD-dependent dihydropyrimidine dehydrogenase PreA subunit